MTSTRAHYDTLLAEIYTWMLGDFDARCAAETARLAALGLRGPGRAFDLGCGSGLHTLALARLGFEVTAVDTSARLLAETRERVPAATCVEADLVEFLGSAPAVDVIACLGDTLTHLPSSSLVSEMMARARERLVPGGRLVLGFRELSRGGPILVRADEDRILTCFLEIGREHAIVHDIVHERAASGAWTMRASAYPKLRLSQDAVARMCEAAGLSIAHAATEAGVVSLVARRDAERG